MKRALLYKKLKDNKVKCLACNNYCEIALNNYGICGVRKNIDGELYLLVYGKAVAVNIDPIEKKPLFHFLPGSAAFSLGTIGCNFKCKFCQNWDISQRVIEEDYGENWLPERIVKFCKEKDIPIIAYTYNEPTIWTEYALDTMKLAHQEGIKNVWVSNGFMSNETLDAIIPYLDAINVDLKSFSPDFYRDIASGAIEPVKKNIRKIWEKGVWEEVTTLVIPGKNDSDKELEKIAEFLVKISPDLPWHISAFYPAYKMLDVPPTSQETLIKAYHIGKRAGLKYVYTGNIPNSCYESTYCPKCGKKIIEREGISLIENKIKKGCCPYCGAEIAGRWEK